MPAASRRTPAGIAQEVVASFSACPDDRLHEVVTALVEHLHAFALEVRLTPLEWTSAMEILAATGRFTDENRHEFILWSDTLGLSMAVDALADQRDPRATESTVEGPFWAPDSPERSYGESIAEQPGGIPLLLRGSVLDVDAIPIGGAEIDVWQNGPNRLYAVQDTDAPAHHLRGRFRTRPDGTYAIVGVRPTPYRIPDDGPVGAMLRATARQSWRPAHIHAAVSAPGFQTLVTHIFDEESDHLDSDAVFAVKSSLVKKFEPREAADPQRPAGIEEPWCSTEVHFVLDRVANSSDGLTPGSKYEVA
jgi:hydroxyquinol 1,2-dioxygenase